MGGMPTLDVKNLVKPAWEANPRSCAMSVTDFDEVINQVILATSCTRGKAEAITWEVHTQGKAVVFEGDFERCFQVQGVLGQIELITEIRG